MQAALPGAEAAGDASRHQRGSKCGAHAGAAGAAAVHPPAGKALGFTSITPRLPITCPSLDTCQASGAGRGGARQHDTCLATGPTWGPRRAGTRVPRGRRCQGACVQPAMRSWATEAQRLAAWPWQPGHGAAWGSPAARRRRSGRAALPAQTASSQTAHPRACLHGSGAGAYLVVTWPRPAERRRGAPPPRAWGPCVQLHGSDTQGV